MKKKYFLTLILPFVVSLFSHQAMAEAPVPVYTAEPDLFFDGTTTPVEVNPYQSTPLLNADTLSIAIEYTLAESDLRKANSMAFAGADSDWGNNYYEAILAMYQSTPGVGVRFDDFGDNTGILPCNIIGENKKIVFILTNTELLVYLDGTLVQTKEGCFTFNKNCSRDLQASSLFIGGFKDKSGNIHNQFKGTIHSFRCYNTALSADEVKTLFDKTQPTVLIENPQSIGGKVEMFVDGATEPTAWGKVAIGSQVTFKATPYFGYKFESLSINDEEVNTVDGVYTTTVQEAMSVSANFTDKTVYVITLNVPHSSSSTVRIYDADNNRYYSGEEIFEETEVRLVFDIKNEETIKSLKEGSSDVELKDQVVNNEYAIGKLTKSLVYHITFEDPNAIGKIEANQSAIRYEGGLLYNNADEITIYNLTGKLLYRTRKEVVDIANWPKGVYIVRSSGETLKFVK